MKQTDTASCFVSSHRWSGYLGSVDARWSSVARAKMYRVAVRECMVRVSCISCLCWVGWIRGSGLTPEEGTWVPLAVPRVGCGCSSLTADLCRWQGILASFEWLRTWFGESFTRLTCTSYVTGANCRTLHTPTHTNSHPYTRRLGVLPIIVRLFLRMLLPMQRWPILNIHYFVVRRGRACMYVWVRADTFAMNKQSIKKQNNVRTCTCVCVCDTHANSQRGRRREIRRSFHWLRPHGLNIQVKSTARTITLNDYVKYTIIHCKTVLKLSYYCVAKYF